MGRAKSKESVVIVDGADYAWAFRHGWLVDWGKGLRGVSVSVAREPGRTRELILDFSFRVFGLERRPSTAQMSRAVAAGIRSAIRAGWEPESRGRAFRHAVGEGEQDGSEPSNNALKLTGASRRRPA